MSNAKVDVLSVLVYEPHDTFGLYVSCGDLHKKDDGLKCGALIRRNISEEQARQRFAGEQVSLAKQFGQTSVLSQHYTVGEETECGCDICKTPTTKTAYDIFEEPVLRV